MDRSTHAVHINGYCLSGAKQSTSIIPFKSFHLLGLSGILNADLHSLGVLGAEADWSDWKELEKYPSFTVLDRYNGRLFCFGVFERLDGLREAWVVLTRKAPLKLVVLILKAWVLKLDPQIASIAGRTEKEHVACKKFLKMLGFKVPFSGVVPMLAREGVF